MTGGLLAVGVGSLILSGICANRREPNGVEFLPFAVALWILVAVGVFAANEAWRGRSAIACVKAFGLCLAIAMGILLLPLVLLTVAVMILEAFGGHL